MNVLVACSYNNGRVSPFIYEQVESLRKSGIIIDYYLVMGKGILGYLRNLTRLLKVIKRSHPDLIHAHFGLTGILCNLQRKVPVITTFHGCDINVIWLRILSYIPLIFSKHCIFISKELAKKTLLKRNYSVIPSGIDLDLFYPIDKSVARDLMNIEKSKKLLLFSGSYDDPVKNSSLAISAISQIEGIELMELKGYTRSEVKILLNACDLALLSSYREGSPQFIKEAMACNCPIVSTDVGDVRSIVSGVEGCLVTGRDPTEIASAIKKALEFADSKQKTNGRTRIIDMKYDLENISKRIIEVYHKVLD